MQRNIDFSIRQCFMIQLAVSGGELAVSGGSHLFHSPRKRSNFAPGFRRDALVSDISNVHQTLIRISSCRCTQRKQSLSFHRTERCSTAEHGDTRQVQPYTGYFTSLFQLPTAVQKVKPTAYCGIGSNPSDQSLRPVRVRPLFKRILMFSRT